jgi:hypothetical protein
MTNRLVNDKDEVAIIYHHRHGSGWSSSCCNEQCLFDPKLAHAILIGDEKEVKRIAKLYDHYFVELSDLKLYWIPRGHSFEVTSYDGKERIIEHGKMYHVA